MKYWEEDRECMSREDLEQLQLERLSQPFTGWPPMFLFTGTGLRRLISIQTGSGLWVN